MKTKILTTTDEDLKIAAAILKNGGNVIFPTETVYGLGADATNSSAVNNIFKAKGRPSDNPLIVHISDMSQLCGIASEIPDNAKLLIDKFWPGPLTIILNKCKNVPYETTAGLDTVAIRMPKSETARRLIEFSEIPVAAPSANLSGKPSPTTAKHCIEDMDGRVDAIVCGADCEVGVESTVIDMSGEVPVLLRPGGITAEQLRNVLGRVDIATSVKEGEKPKSPGLKYKHYSPEAEVIILSGDTDRVYGYVKEQAQIKKVGMLVFDEFPTIDGIITFSLGSINKPSQAAQRLFAALREMDKLGAEIVYAPEIADNNMWSAVRNRLYRAAGEKVLRITPKVLFVCTGNTCRSPMAEGIFNYISKDIKAESAGIFADGSSATANSVLAMAELGIDIDGKKSRQITEEMVKKADLVLTMTKSHKEMLTSMLGLSDKVKTIAEFVGAETDVLDPFGGDLDTYRRCRNTIYAMVEKAVEKL